MLNEKGVLVTEAEKRVICKTLLTWFRVTKRDLPWRKTYDPYHVWISEIMLQQTQMARGVTYFKKWIKRFPDVFAVAEAEEQEILKMWEGLGYYSRARNLHATAKIIVANHNGMIPKNYSELIKLPGIGAYTGAAIASIAGNQDVPVVDANVARIFARLFNIEEPIKSGDGKTQVEEISKFLLPPGKARQYNQALMDLGGLICTPKRVQCDVCPLQISCKSKALKLVGKRPVQVPKKKTVLVEKVAAIILNKGKILIQQRPEKSVWGGMWEFPGGEIAVGDPGKQLLQVIYKNCGLKITNQDHIATVKHQYTHHKITLHAFLCEVKGEESDSEFTGNMTSSWIFPEQLSQYALPAGPRKIVEYIEQYEPLLLNKPANT